MTTPDSWQEDNSHWLCEALAELRQRLENFPEKSTSKDGTKPTSSSTALQQETAPDTEIHSALELLAERLGLSAFEQKVVFLCAAMELDTRIAGL